MGQGRQGIGRQAGIVRVGEPDYRASSRRRSRLPLRTFFEREFLDAAQGKTDPGQPKSGDFPFLQPKQHSAIRYRARARVSELLYREEPAGGQFEAGIVIVTSLDP